MPAQANSIFLSGNDVYVAGYEAKTAGKYDYVAKIWKNGLATALTDGSIPAQANSVYVSGSDVYVAGWIQNAAGKWVGTVWKNGVLTPSLIGAGDGDTAYRVYVAGNDVYVTTGDDGLGRKIWKNGVVFVQTELGKGMCGTICTTGNDVYVALTELNPAGKAVAKIWKNGVTTALSDGSKNEIATKVFVVGNDIYVVGGIINDTTGNISTLKVWKNGETNKIMDIGNASISDVFVK